MKRLKALTILWAISLLVGCVSAPEEPKAPLPSIRDQVDVLTHKEVAPVQLPEKFKVAVQSYTDANGKQWALVDPKDLDRVKAAYISAEGNAKLVDEMNDYTKLVVDRANMVRDIAVLEEHRSSRLELRLEEERAAAEAKLRQNSIDMWVWRLTTVLALAVGL